MMLPDLNKEYDLQQNRRLIQARKQAHLSQREVADFIGVDPRTVGRWEQECVVPHAFHREKLEMLLHRTEEELFTMEESAHAPIIDAMVPTNIPHVLGRDALLTSLKQRILGPSSPSPIVLKGLPGVGKTALSIMLAYDEEIREHFHDGILWASLGPKPHLLRLLSRWGTLLHISVTQSANLSGTIAWAKALRDAIGTRCMLLVIDDAWTVEEALSFKVGGPNCAHLVTTRFPSIASHVSIGGATLVRELGEEESMALLRLLAPQVVDLEMQKAQDLVRACGGLPLALSLMGTYLRKQSYTNQPRRIRAALDALGEAAIRLRISEPFASTEMHPSLPMETPLSLQSMISVTDQLLSGEARTALYALAVFPPKPNSFSEEAALAVANCDTDALDQLNDSGLLESSGPGHYTLHQTIADYARLHLDEAHYNAASERLLAYVINSVEAHYKDYAPLEQASQTILAALEIAFRLGKQAELLRVTIAFVPFLLQRRLSTQARVILQRAKEAAQACNDHRSLASIVRAIEDLDHTQEHSIYYHTVCTLQQEGFLPRLKDVQGSTLSNKGDHPL